MEQPGKARLAGGPNRPLLRAVAHPRCRRAANNAAARAATAGPQGICASGRYRMAETPRGLGGKAQTRHSTRPSGPGRGAGQFRYAQRVSGSETRSRPEPSGADPAWERTGAELSPVA